MDFAEKKLYHQIHPFKLGTDILVTFPAGYYLWQHEPWPAVLIAFIPPIIVSAVMLLLWGSGLIRGKSCAKPLAADFPDLTAPLGAHELARPLL